MKRVASLFWIALIVKLALSAILPITSDEAYYWVWSYHPQLSYYDHPALTSWLFLLSHPFDSFLSLARWPGVILSHATLAIWVFILRRHLFFDEEHISQWLWLALLSPLIGAGALIITPDIPLLFFWSLSLFCFLELLQTPTQSKAFVFGVALGFGLISKYMIVLLPLSLLLVSLWKTEWWRKVGFKIPIIFAGFLVGALPFFIWNMQNDWISIQFQLNHGLGSTQWKPSWTSDYILGQLGVIFPLVVFLVIKGARSTPAWLNGVALAPLFFFFFTSFRGHVEVNWPIVAYPSLLAIAVRGGHIRLQMITRWVWAFVILATFLLITTRYSPFKKPIKTREFFEYESLYQVAYTKSPLYARSYQMASRLSFEAKKIIYKLRGLNRKDAYDFWPGSIPPSHFYLVLEKEESFPDFYFEQGYRVLSEESIDSKFKLLEVQKE